MKNFMKNRKKMLKKLKLDESERYSGRTTGIALATIGKALCDPGTEFAIMDHWPTKAACILLCKIITYYVYTLELEGVTVDTKKLSIRFDLEE